MEMTTRRFLLGPLLVLASCSAFADAASVYQRAMPSIVIIETTNRANGMSRQGSGVVVDGSTVVTNCHVLENADEILVGQPPNLVSGTRDRGSIQKDICLVRAVLGDLQPATRGSTATLRVGSAVYAVGAPRGMSFTLTDGIVSQLRGEPPPIIQTTAAISPGSSGGGLFDEDGNLVGITTFIIEGGQSLNFALPVEWIDEVATSERTPADATSTDYRRRFVDAYRAGNRQSAIDIARSWVTAFPNDAESYYRLGLGLVSVGGEALVEAIEAYNEGLKIAPGYAPLWFQLGLVYSREQEQFLAIAAYKESARLDPGSSENWMMLGSEQTLTGDVDSGVESLERAVALDATNASAWHLLGLAQHQVYLKVFRSNSYRQSREADAVEAAAISALRMAFEQEPRNTRYVLDFGYALSGNGQCDEARDLAAKIKTEDPVTSLALEAHLSRELGPCR